MSASLISDKPRNLLNARPGIRAASQGSRATGFFDNDIANMTPRTSFKARLDDARNQPRGKASKPAKTAKPTDKAQAKPTDETEKKPSTPERAEHENPQATKPSRPTKPEKTGRSGKATKTVNVVEPGTHDAAGPDNLPGVSSAQPA